MKQPAYRFHLLTKYVLSFVSLLKIRQQIFGMDPGFTYFREIHLYPLFSTRTSLQSRFRLSRFRREIAPRD